MKTNNAQIFKHTLVLRYSAGIYVRFRPKSEEADKFVHKSKLTYQVSRNCFFWEFSVPCLRKDGRKKLRFK
jgi:hypothetical protein